MADLPLVGFHFSLELQGKIAGYFTECSGIGSEHEVVDHKVVTADGHQVIMKIPGRLKWENVTLKKGITGDMDMWNWRKDVEDGKVEDARRNGMITMYDQTLKAVAQWEFTRAWPCKLSGPQPKAEIGRASCRERV